MAQNLTDSIIGFLASIYGVQVDDDVEGVLITPFSQEVRKAVVGSGIMHHLGDPAAMDEAARQYNEQQQIQQQVQQEFQEEQVRLLDQSFHEQQEAFINEVHEQSKDSYGNDYTEPMDSGFSSDSGMDLGFGNQF